MISPFRADEILAVVWKFAFKNGALRDYGDGGGLGCAGLVVAGVWMR